MYYRKAYLNRRRHPKMVGLREKLNILDALADGHMQYFWDYVLEQTGTRGTLTERELMLAIGPLGANWQGKLEDFKDALLETEFIHELDGGGYMVINWPRYCTSDEPERPDYELKQRKRDAERKRKERAAAKADKIVKENEAKRAAVTVQAGMVHDTVGDRDYGPEKFPPLRKPRRPRGYDLDEYAAARGLKIDHQTGEIVTSRDSHDRPETAEMSGYVTNMSQSSHDLRPGRVLDKNVTPPTSQGHFPDDFRTQSELKSLNISEINEVSQSRPTDDFGTPASDDVTIASADVHAYTRVEESREKDKDLRMATSPSATSAVPKILAAYVDGLKMKSLSAPNEQTKARIGKAIKKLLNEGDRDGIVYTPEEIIECLKNWFASTYAWVVKTDFKFAAFKSMLSQLKAGPLVNYSKGGRHNEPTVGEDFTKYNPKIHAGRFKADNE